MEIHSVQKGEIPEIKELLKKGAPYVLPHHTYVYWILENYFSTTCFTAREDGKIVGYLSALPSAEKNCAFLWQIAVDSDYQKRGIAGKLLDALTKECRRLQLSSIQMSIDKENDASQTLFRRLASSMGTTLELTDTYCDESFQENVYTIKLN